MESDKKIVKDDINFLEYPNWVICKQSKLTSWAIDKPHGRYEILSPMGLPQHLDKTILYYLLYKLYKEKDLNSYSLTSTRYEIAKNIFGGSRFSTNVYKRIMTSLKKWKAITLTFDGVFYEGDGHTVRYFSVIDEVILRKESGELSIRFSESYVKQLKDTKFYKLVDFEQYKKLHKTSSARLYEILSKNFKERNEWVINIQALAEKITFEKREGASDYYPSDILRHIKPGIGEINKKTELFVDFQYNKESGICIFKKLAKPKSTFIAAVKENASDKKSTKVNTTKQINECVAYFKTLPGDEQNEILEDISRQPFLKFLPDQNFQIYAYLIKAKKWPVQDVTQKS